MGTYYDIVCPEHKEVLRLWKAGMLEAKLSFKVDKKKLSTEGKFIVLIPSTFRTIVYERPKSKPWLEKHKYCKLLFGESDYAADVFNHFEGFAKIDGQDSDPDSQKAFTQINK